MTIKSIVAFLLLSILFSCSSSDSEDTEMNVNKENNNLNTNKAETTNEIALGTFDMKLNGNDVSFDRISIRRSGDEFVLDALNSSDNSFFSTRFHLNGNFGNVTYGDFGTSNDLIITTPMNFAKSVFNFEILSIDENMASAEFTGKLYKDDGIDFDDSESFDISGSFNLPYTRVVPEIEGLEIKAEIDGKTWVSLSSFSTGLGATSGVTEYAHFNETSLEIVFIVGGSTENLSVRNHPFDMNSTNVNRIKLLKYRSSADQNPIEFITTGNLNIQSIEDVFPFSANKIMQATFSFKAINPENNEVISVESGVFKGII